MYEAGKIAVDDILGYVIENELSDTERTVIKETWFRRMSSPKIAGKYGSSVSAVRRTLKRAEAKIYNSLKYVVLYNKILDGKHDLPRDFHYKLIECENGKELIS